MTEVYKVQELYDRFWCIEDGHVRMFLIEGEDKALLIDTGNGTGDLKAFVEGLTQKPIELLITHSHPDHVGATQYFESAYMHKIEAAIYAHVPFGNKEMKIIEIEEGYVFNIGEYAFEVIHTPGHTPGSIVLLDRNKKIMLSNDTVQVGPIFMIDPRSSSFEAFAASMEKLQAMKEDIDIIYPSHFAMPIDASYIDDLKVAAQKKMAGELEGVEGNAGPMKANIYTCGRVSFLAP